MRAYSSKEQVTTIYKAFYQAVKFERVHAEIKRQVVTFMGLLQLLNWDECRNLLPQENAFYIGPCIKSDCSAYVNDKLIRLPFSVQELEDQRKELLAYFRDYLYVIKQFELQGNFLDYAILAVAHTYMANDGYSMDVQKVLDYGLSFFIDSEMQQSFMAIAKRNSELYLLGMCVKQAIKNIKTPGIYSEKTPTQQLSAVSIAPNAAFMVTKAVTTSSPNSQSTYRPQV